MKLLLDSLIDLTDVICMRLVGRAPVSPALMMLSDITEDPLQTTPSHPLQGLSPDQVLKATELGLLAISSSLTAIRPL